MNVEQLLDQVDQLDEQALAQLKAQIAKREDNLHRMASPLTAAEWGAVIRQFVEDFWGDTPEEEKQQIVAAIRTKNIPPDRDE